MGRRVNGEPRLASAVVHTADGFAGEKVGRDGRDMGADPDPEERGRRSEHRVDLVPKAC